VEGGSSKLKAQRSNDKKNINEKRHTESPKYLHTGFPPDLFRGLIRGSSINRIYICNLFYRKSKRRPPVQEINQAMT